MEGKNKGGAPTKYKPEYAEQAMKLCLLGATDATLANFFGVAEQTINNWKRDNPEFFESLKQGKEIADSRVAESLFNRACGYVTKETKIATVDGRISDTLDVNKHYPPDSTAAIFWLKNRQPQMWRDRVEQKVVLSDDFDEVMNDDDQG